MISEPNKWIEELANSGADQMTFHYESDIGINIKYNPKELWVTFFGGISLINRKYRGTHRKNKEKQYESWFGD